MSPSCDHAESSTRLSSAQQMPAQSVSTLQSESLEIQRAAHLALSSDLRDRWSWRKASSLPRDTST